MGAADGKGARGAKGAESVRLAAVKCNAWRVEIERIPYNAVASACDVFLALYNGRQTRKVPVARRVGGRPETVDRHLPAVELC